MLVGGGSITFVPEGSSRPLLPDRQQQTVEGGLIAADDRVDIHGSISLSPKVRFAIESDEPAYWRVGGYDRYTGQGWVRSGQARPVSDGLPHPPGDSKRVFQRVTALSDVGVMPAAWRPISLDHAPEAQVTALGGIKPDRALPSGTTYGVVSERPTASPEELRRAGTDYPEDVESRFTQLPSETPARVDEFTDEVVAGAASPYEKVVRVERWLEANKDYSLDVDRPNDSVADSFLFEMEQGYCTYFATTMVVMLRSEGIPARFVTGYATGQRVDRNEWVVRGQDSHAWVEVYFPDVGWVAFDPTPGGPRQSAERDALEEAREEGIEGVDARGSEEGSWTPPSGPGTDENGTVETANDTVEGLTGERPTFDGPTPVHVTPFEEPGESDGGELPSRDVFGFGLALVLGAAAAIRRTGVGAEAYQLARIQWQGARSTPRADAERAFERLEGLLERRHREREHGETRHSYVEDLSDRGLGARVQRVSELYHRARYGPGIGREEADEVVELVDQLVREETPLLRRLR
jgi:transglutaminase-like putative cysteine protease